MMKFVTLEPNSPPTVSRNQKRRINAVKRVKNKLKRLKAEGAAIQQHKANGGNNKCEQKDDQNGGEQDRFENARDAFGVNAPRAKIAPDSLGASLILYRTG